jgi:thiamine-phosphate pyrophosphorylase
VHFDDSPPALPAVPFVYPIIDTGGCLARGWDPTALADACLRGGARILQLRDKSGSSAAFLALADAIAGRARECGAALIVNDRADIARMSGAAGVHVGQEDLGVEDVRRIVGRTSVVGASTHDAAQIDRAASSESTYVAVGPIFETATKETGYSARGLELVRYASRRGKPVVAIGGITLDRVEAVVKAGAAGLAVITDLLTGDDPERRTRAFIARIDDIASLGAEDRSEPRGTR